ncbi:iron-containing alcohol dehydrogenase [Nakamurella leprariae]|uniref:Iron-containing alcohol dehydrogenase n=1 Tax=Nakamurella leprariae TaxID=2803911 RepID=A0A938YF00_9ACTN|nr:iron-containing alcohol dehydrogenase [Nakamurella leprariae]MBM9466563.1 iron-containing alcohol dehydrogenase [Nakamurella leprariae]
MSPPGDTDAPPARSPGYRQFAGPRRYVQGPGLLDRLGELVAEVGRRPVVLVDGFVHERLGARLATAMAPPDGARSGPDAAPIVACSGEVTRANIAALVAEFGDRQSGEPFDVVVGVGGGKTLDLAKGVAIALGAEMVTCPTIASNDGPTARVVAVYDESHVLRELDALPWNPACVVVDTAVIAQAPVDFLRSGIGDALAKRFEARGTLAGTGLTTQGTRPLLIGRVIADGCYQVLADHAADAVAAVAEGRLTPAVEAVVEAVVLMSGIGYENGGLSVAHCMTRGLMAGRGTADHLHGYHVAYGLLVQLALERQPDQVVGEVTRLLRVVGLPTSLGELGMGDPTEAEIGALATATAKAPHVRNTSAEVTAATVAAAIRSVEGWSAAR